MIRQSLGAADRLRRREVRFLDLATLVLRSRARHMWLYDSRTLQREMPHFGSTPANSASSFMSPGFRSVPSDLPCETSQISILPQRATAFNVLVTAVSLWTKRGATMHGKPLMQGVTQNGVGFVVFQGCRQLLKYSAICPGPNQQHEVCRREHQHDTESAVNEVVGADSST